MSELRRVTDKTPILDAAEAQGGKIGLIAKIGRFFRGLAGKRHRAKVQAEIDKRWHDELRARQHIADHQKMWDARCASDDHACHVEANIAASRLRVGEGEEP